MRGYTVDPRIDHSHDCFYGHLQDTPKHASLCYSSKVVYAHAKEKFTLIREIGKIKVLITSGSINELTKLFSYPHTNFGCFDHNVSVDFIYVYMEIMLFCS